MTPTARPAEVELGENVGCEEAERAGDLSGATGQGVLGERKEGKEQSTAEDGEGLTPSRVKGHAEEHGGCGG